MFFRLLIFCLLPLTSLAQNGKKFILANEIVEEKHEFENLLIDILLNSAKPYKCIAFLTDQTYYDIFEHKIFQKLGIYITYFFILIEESDDLLSPFPDTQDALNMIKRQDCQMYIILLSNGLQISRLLQFGDRYRILDTRANFVLLYDNRIFQKEMHYIWKRIVNVVFIREYRGGRVRRASAWFELSTVPFPSPIKGVFIPRRIDIWRQNKFRTGVELFRDKTSDLKNQTIKVVTFQHVPATLKVATPQFKTPKTVMQSTDYSFAGIEIEILSTIAGAMNFFPELYEPVNADTEFWGNKQSDGQFTGIFGEMIKGRADIGLGDFYYTPYILDLMDLTTPYYTECLTFLTPESLTDNSWKTLILPFKPVMWICVLLCLCVSAFIFYYLGRFHTEINRHKIKSHVPKLQIPPAIPATKDPSTKYTLMKSQFEILKEEGEPEGLYVFGDPINSFLYTYSMLLVVSLPKLPTGWSLRMLTGWFWLYCTLVVVAYRASMTAILANPAPRVTIDTLVQLIKSNVATGGWGEVNQAFFSTSLDSIGQIIGRKFEIINDTDFAVDRVAMGEFALYENVHFLKQATVKRQLRIEMQRANSTNNSAIAEGERNLHIMSNCVINMPISVGLQKNSPIKPRIDMFIRRIIEAGLIEKWLDDVMQTTLNAETTVENTTKALMDMWKFFGAVLALLIGYLASILVLVGELVYFNFVVRRHPKFDKYSKRIYHDKKL